MAKDTAHNASLAKKISAALKKSDDPTTMTVKELAAEVGESEEEVARVLDTHTPDGEHHGDGAGGPWIEEEADVEPAG